MTKHRIRKLEVKEGINPIKLVSEKGKELARVVFEYSQVRGWLLIVPKSIKIKTLEVG